MYLYSHSAPRADIANGSPNSAQIKAHEFFSTQPARAYEDWLHRSMAELRDSLLVLGNCIATWKRIKLDSHLMPY